jgi:autotransporter-associated beta strand repeat
MTTNAPTFKSRSPGRLSATFLAALLGSLAASQAINYTWNNTGTDWNTPSSWNPASGSGIPNAGGDVVIFNTPAVTQPDISSSISVSRITANSSSATGYTLTSSGGATLTLGATAVGTSSAINYLPATGSLTVNAPIILGAAGGSTQTVNVNAAGGTVAIGGPISSTHSVQLQKTGAGTLILSSADNSYSGGTLISAGTLLLNGSGVLGSGALTLDGGTFDISGITGSTYTHAAALNGAGTLVGGGKTLEVSELAASGTLLTSHITLSLSGTSVFDFSNPSFGADTYSLVQGSISGTETVIFGGTLQLNFAGGSYANGSSVQIFAVDNYVGAFDSVVFSGLEPGQQAVFDASTGTVTVVPEPGAVVLVGLGSVLLVGRRRMRRATR